MPFFKHTANGQGVAASPPPREGFVELSRRFAALSKKSHPDAAADESYLFQVWGSHGRYDWQDLLKMPLVVVLGEPGSGKSWEMENQAAMLAKAGHHSFFLRLEELIARPLDAVLGPEVGAFNAWKSNTEVAIFFLDSVDESKLNRAEDFHSALKHFREALPPDFGVRSHILLSSRVSEWHPETDGARVREYFGLTGRQEKAEPQDEETSNVKSSANDLLVVQIEPLTREQVATLAEAKRFERADALLAALDQAHAWEFARRPIDVMALADFWQEHGRIGTLTELIDVDLARNLRERRARIHDPLSDEDARLGAEALAAGVVFCGEPNIKVSDANLTGPGLDGQLCLPATFTRDQFDALLTRPIFDGASFGRVRFHHRRIREYLAASWMRRRMAAGCSLAELEALFFDRISGRRVIRSSRAAVAAWLCAGGEPWSNTMRRWVLESSPDLSLRYGDPHALPLDFKQSLLTCLVNAARTRTHLWLETDKDALSRLADHRLLPQIEAIISDRQLAGDLRATMLKIVRHGQLTQCVPAILTLVASPEEPDDLKAYAVVALRELKHPTSLLRLSEIAATLPRATPALSDALVDALFPSQLSVDQFVTLLLKTHERHGRRPDLHWQIKGRLEERLQPEQAAPLLVRLLALLESEPRLPAERGEPAVSKEFAWLRPLLEVTLTALLKKPELTAIETSSSGTALTLLGWLREGDGHHDEHKGVLQQLTLAHPAVRREFFWAAVRRRRPIGLHTIDHPLDIFARYYGLLEPAFADVSWLVVDLATLTDELEREVALRHAMQWWNDAGRPWNLRWRIRRTVGNNSRLRTVLREIDRAGRLRPLKRYYFRLESAFHHHRRKGRRGYAWLMERIGRMRSRYFLWRNMDRIALGELPGVVKQLLDQADPENRDRWTVSRWKTLERRWGAKVVEATRAACKRFWRTYRPELAHESTDPSSIPNAIIFGLTGLQAEWKDRELDFDSLSEDEVKLATRYAMREMNAFPLWLHPLAERRQGPVGEIFNECIAAEWDASTDQRRSPEGLQRLVWSGAPLLPCVRSTVVAKLQQGDPSGEALRLVLGHLLNSVTPPLAELRALARSRVAAPEIGAGSLVLWFATWLRMDPSEALDAWEAHIRPRSDADTIMILVASSLQDRDMGSGRRVTAPLFRDMLVVRKLLPIVFTHINRSRDIDRSEGGAYTPDVRDYAQEFRDGLLRQLADSTDPIAADVLLELSTLPLFANQRDWLLHLRDQNLQQRADRERWRACGVRQFELEHETDPQTDRDLYRIVLKRFEDVKNDVERSDLGLRTHLRPNDSEARLRIWLAQELIRRSRDRYSVPQEAVIDQNQRPDIRLENPQTDAVSIEIKWAQDWSFNELMVALEEQLLGQYLRAHNSQHGVLVLGMHSGERQGWDPPTGGRLRFPEMVAALQTRAAELERAHPEVKRLSVVAIDFRDPAS